MITFKQITILLNPPIELLIKNNSKLSDKQSSVLAFIKKHGPVSSAQIQKGLFFEEHSVNRVLRILADEGLVSAEIRTKKLKNRLGGITTSTFRVYSAVDGKDD